MEGVTHAGIILKRAVTLDTDKRYSESLVCYQEGIQMLLNTLKGIDDEGLRGKIRSKMEEYIGRAENVKKTIEKLKNDGDYREQLQIDEDATGYPYEKIFSSRYLDDRVHRVEVDDPYIRSPHQCDNFLRFTELCLRMCPNLNEIVLRTKADGNGHSEQKQRLESISQSVHNMPWRKANVQVEYSDVLHDREIRLNTGWIIKIGRGLDYFKPVNRYSLGWTDYHFRPCRATTVDIFHITQLKLSSGKAKDNLK